MGQMEILKFLELQRIKKIDKYFTIKEIQKGLKDSGCTNGQLEKVGNCCYKLSIFGFLDVRGKGVWDHKKLFRFKGNPTQK